jgi:hypothetical protein
MLCRLALRAGCPRACPEHSRRISILTGVPGDRSSSLGWLRPGKARTQTHRRHPPPRFFGSCSKNSNGLRASLMPRPKPPASPFELHRIPPQRPGAPGLDSETWESTNPTQPPSSRPPLLQKPRITAGPKKQPKQKPAGKNEGCGKSRKRREYVAVSPAGVIDSCLSLILVNACDEEPGG